MRLQTVEVPIIVKTYVGPEARTILAQAEGYRRIQMEILQGHADRDPENFLATCKIIGQQQAEKGA